MLRRPFSTLPSHRLHRWIPTTSVQKQTNSQLDCPPSIPPTPYAVVCTLAAAAKSPSPTSALQHHSPIVKLGLTSNIFITTALLDVYCRSHQFTDAQQLFDEMPQRNVVTWNTLIHGLSQSPHPIHAVEAFIKMTADFLSPSASGVTSALIACSRMVQLGYGLMLHCISIVHGFGTNVVAGTALVDMYSKCADMDGAHRVFDEMPERNTITWTSLVTGYALAKRAGEAMVVVREMRRLGVECNKVTYNSLLTSLSYNLVYGEQVHCLVIKEGLEADSYVAVTLLTLYSKCGSMGDFVKLRFAVSDEDQISWNSVVAGFAHLGDGRMVLDLFSDMRKKNIEIDYFTFASVLRAIGIRSTLQEGRQIHALIFKTGNAFNVSIQNGLISMYARCGLIDDSKLVFSSMNAPDLISWNAVLSGCAQHGYGWEAVELLEQMRENGVRPDHTTFLSVLTACCHVGLVEKGLEFFYMMEQFAPPIVAGVEHYACVVDLLGRAGRLPEAEAFVNSMTVKPGISVYRALLSACQVHGCVEIAKRAAGCLFELFPNDPSTHVLLSNIFAADGSWENAAGVRKIMKGKGVRKNIAQSWINDHTPVVLVDPEVAHMLSVRKNIAQSWINDHIPVVLVDPEVAHML